MNKTFGTLELSWSDVFLKIDVEGMIMIQQDRAVRFQDTFKDNPNILYRY